MEWPLVVPGDVGRLFVVRAATVGVVWPPGAWRGRWPAALLYIGASAGRAIGGSKGARRRGRVLPISQLDEGTHQAGVLVFEAGRPD